MTFAMGGVPHSGPQQWSLSSVTLGSYRAPKDLSGEVTFELRGYCWKVGRTVNDKYFSQWISNILVQRMWHITVIAHSYAINHNSYKMINDLLQVTHCRI